MTDPCGRHLSVIETEGQIFSEICYFLPPPSSLSYLISIKRCSKEILLFAITSNHTKHELIHKIDLFDKPINCCTDLNSYIYVTTLKKIIVIDPRQNFRVINDFSCGDVKNSKSMYDQGIYVDDKNPMYYGICVDDKNQIAVASFSYSTIFVFK